MTNCLNCNMHTNNPKFCSRNCSAKFNNKHKPKRKLKNTCKDCGKLVRSNVIRCKDCYKYNLNIISDNTTIRELIDRGYTRQNKFSLIRLRARKVAEVLPNICSVCKYDKHVHVCHIKSISSYSYDSTMLDINNIKNLVKLCPNCHWEFDNGLLDIMF